MVDTLDSCFDDDINNDVNSLYVEIIERLETQLSYVHGEGEKQHMPITLESI